jgi:hypothetical protein
MPQASQVGRYWYGDGPLWRVFWIYGVAASIVMSALIVASVMLKWFTPPLLAGVLMAAAIYAQWILVSIWRCAPNVKTDALGVRRDAWGVLARWLTVSWLIGAISLAAILFHFVVTIDR